MGPVASTVELVVEIRGIAMIVGISGQQRPLTHGSLQSITDSSDEHTS